MFNQEDLILITSGNELEVGENYYIEFYNYISFAPGLDIRKFTEEYKGIYMLESIMSITDEYNYTEEYYKFVNENNSILYLHKREYNVHFKCKVDYSIIEYGTFTIKPLVFGQITRRISDYTCCNIFKEKYLPYILK